MLSQQRGRGEVQQRWKGWGVGLRQMAAAAGCAAGHAQRQALQACVAVQAVTMADKQEQAGLTSSGGGHAGRAHDILTARKAQVAEACEGTCPAAAGCMRYLQRVTFCHEIQLQSMWHHHASVDECPETLAQRQLRCMCMLPPTAPPR